MKIKEIVKKYAADKSHLHETARLSLLLFSKLKPIFRRLENYDNKEDLALLNAGAMLHDIGINFEALYNCPHNKAGAKFILNNKPEEISEENLNLLACLIRYHRKSLPDETKHELYALLSQKDKAKVNFLGSIIKLSDALDASHRGLVLYVEFKFDKELNLLTLILPNNIMLDIETLDKLNKKKDFFEKAFFVKLEFNGGCKNV